MRTKLLCTFGMGALLLAGNALAAVTYQYIGVPYSKFESEVPAVSPLIFGDHLIGEVVFSDAITEDFTGSIVNRADILSVTLSSGLVTLSTADPSVFLDSSVDSYFRYFRFFEFENGMPIYWDIELTGDDVPNDFGGEWPLVGPWFAIYNYFRTDDGYHVGGNRTGLDFADSQGLGMGIYARVYGSIDFDSDPNIYQPPVGTWARVAPVPLPAAVWFLGTACGLLGLARRQA